VVATEVSKSSVAAAKRNFELNDISNVFVARMASEEFTSAWKERRAMKRCVTRGAAIQLAHTQLDTNIHQCSLLNCPACCYHQQLVPGMPAPAPAA
jgi:hypothetical protein